MHYEALTDNGKKIFPLLSKFTGFYLAGGTAMALHLGHRISEDFDLFCGGPLGANLLSEVEKIFFGFPIQALVNNADQLTVLAGNVKITLLHYPVALVAPLVNTNGVPMLDVRELAATKAYAIGRRGTLKDYVDVYFAVSGGAILLPQLLELAAKKYSDGFNSRLFLEQLVFLDDVPDMPIRFLKSPVSKTDIQKFFESEIKKIAL